MLREAIEYLIRQGKEQERIIRAPDFLQTGRHYIVDPDGTLNEITPYQPHPTARAESTIALAALITDEKAKEGTDVEVWYSTSEIVALIRDVEASDSSVRWRRHHLPLPHHAVFERAQALTRTEPHSQLSLIRMLRSEFNGHVNPDVIERFRALRLQTDGSGLSVIRQGNASIDRKLAQKAQDAQGGGIPDEITIDVPVFDLQESRTDEHEIDLLIDAIPNGEDVQFDVTAIRNSLARAEEDALATLIDTLKPLLPEGVPVWRGQVQS